MNKRVCMYSDNQLEEMDAFVEKSFGSHYDYVVHEIESEYVHTDTFIVKNSMGEKSFITCGMGAGEMNSPTDLKRCEVLLSASKKLAITSGEGLALSSELVAISKFPFRENTWFGPGHTINVSGEFKETFGYDFLAFCDSGVKIKLEKIDEDIHFLRLVPLYESEREWCVENNTIAFIDKLHEKYGDDIFKADFKRDEFSPSITEEELAEYNTMSILGINKELFKSLCEYLKEADENDEEVSYDDISRWISENK